MGTFYIVSAIMMAFLTGLGAGFLVVLGMQKQLKKDFTTVLLVLFCLCGGFWSGKLAADGVNEFKVKTMQAQLELLHDINMKDAQLIQDSLFVNHVPAEEPTHQ